MTPAEREGGRLLRGAGITDFKFTGQTVRHGTETRLVYTRRSGLPVMDAPGVMVRADGSVHLVPWSDVVL